MFLAKYTYRDVLSVVFYCYSLLYVLTIHFRVRQILHGIMPHSVIGLRARAHLELCSLMLLFFIVVNRITNSIITVQTRLSRAVSDCSLSIANLKRASCATLWGNITSQVDLGVGY